MADYQLETPHLTGELTLHLRGTVDDDVNAGEAPRPQRRLAVHRLL